MYGCPALLNKIHRTENPNSYPRPGNLTPYFDAISTILFTFGGPCGRGGIVRAWAGSTLLKIHRRQMENRNNMEYEIKLTEIW
jgi:hypothetical protein